MTQPRTPDDDTPATEANVPLADDPEWLASLDAIAPKIDADTGEICKCFGCYQGDGCYFAKDPEVVTIVEMRKRLGQEPGFFDPNAHDYMYCGCRKCGKIRRANGQKRLPPPEWNTPPDPWDMET